MLAEVTRSGEAESFHDGAVAVMDPTGRLLSSYGDIDRPFFARSAVKPFQATVALEAGAELPPEWLAVAASSHEGAPIHLGIVDAMLTSAGLGRDALQTPPSWPEGTRQRDRLLRASHRWRQPRFHNCSGKHAAFLMACVASKWDPSTYLAPDHPLQRRVTETLADVTDAPMGTPAIDGCGAPTHRVTVRNLATAFARLGNDDRFADVLDAMHRYPRLVSGPGVVDAEVAVRLGAAAKRGAEGILGVTIPGRGSIAIRVLDGSMRPVGPVVVDVLDQMGWATPSMITDLRTATEVAMSGGGRPVGTVRSLVRLHA